MTACPTCGQPWSVEGGTIPPEPPVGTWVRDADGSVSVRNADGWAPAPHGFYGLAQWEPMWKAHGPLIECPPWGVEEHQAANS